MSDQPSSSPNNPTPVALLVAGAFFMENLDGTVIATALPRMAQSFHAAPAALATGMSAYLVTLAVFIPASGWAADRFGAGRVFTAAVALFTFASVLCGASRSPLQFTAARVLQGCGGALMTPVGRLVVLRDTPKPALMRAIATLTWPALVAPVLGPPLGGFIAAATSWRWIFLINLPIGLAGLLLSRRLLGHADARQARPFDGVGFALNGAALAALLTGLDRLGRAGPDGRVTAAVLCASAGAGWLAVRHARRHPHPLVSLDAFADRSFAVTMGGGFVSRVAISTTPFLLPLLFQLGLGLDPFASGLLVLWYGLTNIGIKPATSAILRRFGFRAVLIVNTGLSASAIAACGLIGRTTPVWLIVLLLMLAGASRSLQFTALNTLAFSEVPPGLTGAANTLFNTAFQLAIGLGIAIGAVALKTMTGLLGPDPLPAFGATFLAAGTLALLPLADVLRLRPDAGAVVSGHGARNAAA